MIALVDCNSCYASCEQIYRPDIRGQPIVVLSNNDGCIVTRNKEAKALNIPNLAPYFKVADLLKAHRVNVFSSNYELYGDTSKRIMSLLRDFGREIEVYSIDEAFLDVRGVTGLLDHGRVIKEECWRQQRMPVCVGIGKTKTLAKLANHMAKKSNKLNGVCVINELDEWTQVFKKLPVTKVWGIGSKIGRRLESMDIRTVDDFRRASAKRLRKSFGVVVERTHAELHGFNCIDFELISEDKNEIYSSRSFGRRIVKIEELKESVANYAMRAMDKLRAQNGRTKQIYVSCESSRFSKPYYRASRSIKLDVPTNDSREIVVKACALVNELYQPGVEFVRAGIGLSELSVMNACQPDLFTPEQTERSKKTMVILDDINKRFGKGSMTLARQGTTKPWAMARRYRSPAYTTRLSDIPIVRL